MQQQTRATVGGSAPAGTPSRQSKRSQQEESKAILENKWWPFDRADAKLLEKIHRQKIKTQPKEIETGALL